MDSIYSAYRINACIMIFREKLFQLADSGAEQNAAAILLMDVHIADLVESAFYVIFLDLFNTRRLKG